MASSSEDSLATDGMPFSPSQLTPRSRVKAMLATLDDESDGEVNAAAGNATYQAKTNSKSILSTALDAGISTSSNIDESEEDEVLYKPRGKMAAKMHVVRSDSEEDADQPQTARDRVRKLLMTEKTSATEAVDIQDNPETASNSDSDAAPSRKQAMRKSRRATPMSSPSIGNRSNGEGLLVSPTTHKSQSPLQNTPSSDDDLPANPIANARFLALVEKKRQERLAKEEAIQLAKTQKAAERARLSERHSKLVEEDVGGYSDDEGGRQLTQQVCPTRKASKRALEEMHRETQRMSRNMQLAHQAKTKKKITKSSLFAKFNYKPPVGIHTEDAEERPPTSSSSAPQSDAEMKDTPPTSPVSQVSDAGKDIVEQSGRKMVSGSVEFSKLNDEEVLPTRQEALSQNMLSSASSQLQPNRADKGKEKAVEEPAIIQSSLTAEHTADKKVPLLQIRNPKGVLGRTLAGNDSDSDLEIVNVKTPLRKYKESVFDRVPAKQAKESHSLQALRMLAHITSPGKQSIRDNAKKSVTAVELHLSLQQRARQQASREREERLQALRDKGVIVQTAEEREKEMVDMENLVAKARREGEEILKREKEAAKKERKANGEVDPSADGSDDDEEWVEEKEKFSDQLSISGSESDGDDEGDASGEEEEDEDEEVEEMDSADEENGGVEELKPKNTLIDNEASQTVSEVEGANIPDADDNDIAEAVNDEDNGVPIFHGRRRTKNLVVSDDEEDQGVIYQSPTLTRTESPMARVIESPKAPPSVLRSATKTFIPGVTVAGPAGLGLTQIFAGTMDDTQAGDREDYYTQGQISSGLDTAQDSLAFLRRLPPPVLPSFEPTLNEDSQELVEDSQTQISQVPESPINDAVSQGIQLHFSQSQIHGFDSMLQYPVATQTWDYPDPTQDAGFKPMSPIGGRFVELAPSTIDTVILQPMSQAERVEESPIAKRKGKLRRRNVPVTFSDDEEVQTKATGTEDDDEFSISADIFDVMRKASKRKQLVVDDFDKKKSGAKEMVQEQAEESEDEYAGLGGASDDESGGEADAYVQEMIDDEGGRDIDERKLAAFYANKERASDEKQIEKLYKDITNGMLRRKRGADYDLSDSDDGGEARRRMKRKEFAKMRKALLEDERIGKIAENPKKTAFLHAIEDRGDEDEMDFLEDLGDGEEMADSQSQSQSLSDLHRKDAQRLDDSTSDIPMGPPKRKLDKNTKLEKRLPPHLRRTNPSKRPANLSEIRKSLSSLIEEPNSTIMSHNSSGSDSELEFERKNLNIQESQREKENLDPFASRRKTNMSVVDRISLKRAGSNTASSTTRLAFSAPSSAPGFKVPALLRRTTTSNSISSGSSSSNVSSTERMAGALGDDSKVAKKAGKNSGVHYFARENERKMKLEEGEKRRNEKRWKGAEGRRKVVGGLFRKGKFE